MAESTHPAASAPQRAYCTLVYRRRHAPINEVQSPILALVQRTETAGLTIAVAPEWLSMVNTEDAPEIAELLDDLVDRVETDPDALWKQIGSVNWGLLVTGERGPDLMERLDLVRLLNRFKRLS